MRRPTPPRDDEVTLPVLIEMGYLDSESDEFLDRVASYCCRRFGVPISLVSLVDAERQWLLASTGIEVKAWPGSVSFCGRAVAGNHMLVVNDAAEDGRFRDDPLVMGLPLLRFYVGCPLRIKGQPIGTLCIIGLSARGFTSDEARELTDVSDAVSWYLTRRKRGTASESAPGVKQLARPAGARDLPSTEEEASNPWGAAVNYMLSKPNAVESRMLGQVAFGFAGSGRDRQVSPWEKSVLDPRAVDIAQQMIAARSTEARSDDPLGEGDPMGGTGHTPLIRKVARSARLPRAIGKDG